MVTKRERPGTGQADEGAKEEVERSLDDPALYLNREISWLKFNRRVLEETEGGLHPLLEKVKFLAICGSNLDEFFMARVPGLYRQAEKGALEPPPDGMNPQTQLDLIKEEVDRLNGEYAEVWDGRMVPALAAAGVHIHGMDDITDGQRAKLRAYFEQDLFPILTPMAIDAAHPFPFISGLAINIAAVVKDASGRERMARIKVPSGLFPRLVCIDGERATSGEEMHLVFLEDLVMDNLDLLFTGMEVMSAHPFRVTRDAEIEIELDETSDLLTAVEEGLESRRIGVATRLEVSDRMPDRIVSFLASKLDLPPDLVYRTSAPLGLVDLWELHSIKRPDLLDTPFLPYVPKALANEEIILDSVCHQDAVLYHPYDSFQPVVGMIKRAAVDPDVLAIKITLYRVDRQSSIVEALMEARRHGKVVAAVLELKAKFDETNNILWARQMEQAGIHVVYGPVDIKVHAKMCLIVRRGRSGLTRICHLSSGNYNSQTARTYGDLGYITCERDLAADVSDLFNTLTGYGHREVYRRLLVSPHGIRKGMEERIEREIQRHRENGDGYMAFKLNALVDKGIIKSLYRASMAGVRIELNVRGLCCLRPGVPGVSENITVTSIVGRFLEHARIYYFRNGGDEEMLLGSSDMMPRNLDRRVETLFPVQDARVREAIKRDILDVHLKDTAKAKRLLADGTYEKVVPEGGEKPLSSQDWLLAHRGEWHG